VTIDMAPSLGGWQALLPAYVVAATALVVMILDLTVRDTDRGLLAGVGVAGLLVAVATAAWLATGGALTGFDARVRADGFGLFLASVACLGAAATLLLSVEYIRERRIAAGDYETLVLLATVGMVVMALAADLLVVFLALEVMSLAVYVLAGMLEDDGRSIEAALKYFLLGAFASAFLLYGIAFFYGTFGSTRIDVLAQAGHLGPGSRGTLQLALGLLLIGFGFKVALMPFHVWTPDVYEGAPTPVTAFMAVGVKAAGFAAFARVFGTVFTAGLGTTWTQVLWVLAVGTMTVGNVTALAQGSVKRMLAYSSIAHAGYAAVGLVVGTSQGLEALAFYLLCYAVMNVGAFGVLLAIGRLDGTGERYADLAGVGLRHPLLGVAMSVCMLSLGGMPLTAGFVGKFQLFAVAVNAGYVWLAVIGVLNSLVSFYYYLGVLVQMFMVEGPDRLVPLRRRPVLVATIALAVVGTLAIGILPGWPMSLAAAAQLGR
jgi:NADH-quinone oxidoreductase subunit N